MGVAPLHAAICMSTGLTNTITKFTINCRRMLIFKMNLHTSMAHCFCAVVGALAVLCGSCASTARQVDAEKTVYITNTKKIVLLPPQCMDGTIDALQFFTGTFGERTFSARVYLHADAETISLMLLNDFGVDMGTLTYTNTVISFDSAYIPKKLKPQYIVADLQSAYYQIESLKILYGQSGLSFIEEISDFATVRKIFDNSRCIETIIRQNGSVTIQNHLRGYTYTLEAEP